MNWFGRYGIPGAYFIGLMAGWVYAFYPSLFKEASNHSDSEWLLALAATTFLPIGYIISILGQAVYLNWRRCFAGCRKLRGWLGLHGAAMDKVGICLLGVRGESKNESKKKSKDEAIVEARTLLLTASRNGPYSVDTHRYLRDWIARRMDVMAINQSLILATILAAPIFVLWLIQGRPFPIVALIPLITSIVTILVAACSVFTLRRQVIEVIAGIYRRYM